MAVLAVLEMIIGFSRSNVHIIRDVMMSGLMIASMVFSIRMSHLSRKKANGHFNFGYRRVNILAAFIMTV